ncbi:PEP-CTERM sorting domain-containing protein [Myxococcota bacterium]|nr:PEP-CTERM sorting domain-containing protein [Myxococcota bacterium]MCZ7619541.1 PEP-CTERM sorting domain-containing protein [Myxococcota bacterium]
MSRNVVYGRALAALCALLLPATASALKFDWQIANQSNSNGITVSDGGVNATASGWGGLTNPQNSIDPSNPSASALNLGVNIGTALGFGRGVGCGTVISVSQCDLISPSGEDALLITFDALVEVTRVYGTLIEDPDDISVWGWTGSAWDLIGTDNCGGFSLCGSFSEFDGEDLGHVSPGNLPYTTTALLIVAENSGASAFRLGFVEGNVIPEPGTFALISLGMTALALRSRRRHR